MGRLLAGLAVMCLGAACSQTTVIPPATPAQIALQSGDVPKTMSICPQSGDVDHFLKLSTIDSTIYQEIRADWTKLKTLGATAGYMRVFTNKPAQCDGIFALGSASDASLQVLASLVVEFKDAKGAISGFNNAGAFGAGALTAGPGVQTGSGTGLGPNSLVFSQGFQDQTLYFAYWQNLQFDVVVLGLNTSPADARHATTNISSRVH